LSGQTLKAGLDGWMNVFFPQNSVNPTSCQPWFHWGFPIPNSADIISNCDTGLNPPEWHLAILCGQPFW